jgi:hypothetical protein
MKVVIYFVTKDYEKIERIEKRFGASGLSVNREAKADVSEEDMKVLKETERRGFIQIRNKLNKNF